MAATLTRRQREVVVLLARGLSNRAMAQELTISHGRAANLVRSILTALGLHSRAQVAAWALEHGLAGTQDRLLTLLERLLQVQAADLQAALTEVANVVAAELGADKVDAFLLEPATQTLVAAGTSETPMGRKERALGLDRLPLANGGRTVEVFQTWALYLTGHADHDPGELLGVVHGLGVRSTIAVPLAVGGQRRGVLLASALAADFFTERDLRLFDAVAHWVGLVAGRAELQARLVAAAAEAGRRVSTQQLVTLIAEDLGAQVAPLLNLSAAVERRAQRQRDSETLTDEARLHRGVQGLHDLVADLRDAARLEQGVAALRQEPVELAALVGEVLELLETPPPMDVRMWGAEHMIALVDPIRLRQALEILLMSALATRSEGTLLTVEVSSGDGVEDRMAVISMTAQVAGSAVEAPPHLIEQAVPSGAFPAPQVSNGLGLYLAGRIAAAHGGSLTAHEAAGLGRRFELRLPLQPT